MVIRLWRCSNACMNRQDLCDRKGTGYRLQGTDEQDKVTGGHGDIENGSAYSFPLSFPSALYHLPSAFLTTNASTVRLTYE